MSDGGRSIFSQLIEPIAPAKQEPQLATIPRGPLLAPIVPAADANSTPSEKLLDFCVNRWPREVVRLRELQQFGPRSLRNRKSAMALAEQLVAAGWLSPVKGRQCNEVLFRIVRGPSG
jgi:hypothetical protein